MTSCTCRRCMPPRRKGAARITFDVLRPMLHMIVTSMSRFKTCTRPAARLLALLCQDWLEAQTELRRCGALTELASVYDALGSQIMRAIPAFRGGLPSAGAAGFFRRMEHDADDGDDSDDVHFGRDVCLCISDCGDTSDEEVLSRNRGTCLSNRDTSACRCHCVPCAAQCAHSRVLTGLVMR